MVWLATQPSKAKRTFAANRIQAIRDYFCCAKYCDTKYIHQFARAER